MISNPKAWARANKKAFANKMITSAGVEPHDEPAAFFMAGLPGAGKTEFTKNLIGELSLKTVRIDMDEIATHIDGYEPQQAHAFREAASDVLNALLDRSLHRKVDFIMDGTFRSSKAIANILRCQEKGYIIKLLFVYQEPLLAWEFTKAREIVEKRAIDREGFIDAYFDIFSNIDQLATMNIANLTIDFVIKDADNTVGYWYQDVCADDIDKYIVKRYNRDELERMLPK